MEFRVLRFFYTVIFCGASHFSFRHSLLFGTAFFPTQPSLRHLPRIALPFEGLNGKIDRPVVLLRVCGLARFFWLLVGFYRREKLLNALF